MDRASTPLIIEGNRPFIDTVIELNGGGSESARLWVDTGGGAFIVTEALARKLGLEWGEAFEEDTKTLGRALAVPLVTIGGFPLELVSDRVFVELGADNLLPKGAPGRAEGMLPGHVLARHHVVFDYPAEL